MPKGNGIKIPEWKPGMPSRWVVVGPFGKRVPDQILAVRAYAHMTMVERGEQQATVHGGDCPVGKTSRNPCNCNPEVITR